MTEESGTGESGTGESGTGESGAGESGAAGAVRARLRAELRTAMRSRDRVAVSALRSALAAIDNAESSGIAAPAAGAIENTALGPGAAEVPRRELSKADVVAVLRAEISERDSAAATLDAAQAADRAAELRAQSALLRRLLSE
ncbi:hypothetical protein ACWDTD_15760 [Gordonia sp. NPDC003425]